MRIKRFIHLLAVIVTTMCMSGCTPKQIIEDPDAKYRLTALEDSQLEKNTYYVKDKTKFYATYMPNGNAQGKATKLDAKRLLWTQKDNELIPTYYKGELIAYYSEEPSLTNIGLERFKDIGFSVGLKGAKYENGYVTFAASSNCIKGSSMATALSNLPSDNIRIVTINGNPVSEDTVNAAGVIASLGTCAYADQRCNKLRLAISNQVCYYTCDTKKYNKGIDTRGQCLFLCQNQCSQEIAG